MKNLFKLACAAMATGIVLQSCSKLDQDLVQAPEKTNPTPSLQLEPSKYSISSVGVFPKEELNIFSFYHHPDGSMQINSQLSGETGLSSEQINLKVYRTANQIAFVSAGSATDTVFVAYFNEEGKVRSLNQGNAPDDKFLPTNFYYQHGKLSKLEVLHGKMMISSAFTYDSKGNLSGIKEFSNLDGETVTTSFGYDYSSTADAQFYFDLPTGFINNSFAMLEYVGLFPELQSKNLRTSVKKSDSYSETTINYANHKLSLDGQLLAYDIVDSDGKALRNHKIEWKAKSGDNALAVSAKK